MDTQGIDPQPVSKLRISNADMAGDTLCVAFTAKNSEGAGEVFEYPSSFFCERCKFGNGIYWFAAVAHRFKWREWLRGLCMRLDGWTGDLEGDW